jgi:PAS domain S-box-containing protein
MTEPGMKTGGRLRVRSLKARIVILFSLSFLAAGWAVMTILASSLQRDTERLLANQQFSFVSNLADEIDQKILLEIDALQRVAESIHPGLLADPGEMADYLATRIGLHGLFTGGLTVVGEDGRVEAEYPARGRMGMLLASAAFVARVHATGLPAVSEPFWSPFTEEPVVAMAVPVRDAQGRSQAVLMGVVALAQPHFLGQATGHRVGESGGVYILSPQAGMIVVSSGAEGIFTPAPRRGRDAMLDRYVDGFEGSGVAIGMSGAPELSSGRRIPTTGWVLVARLPTGEAFQPIVTMRWWVAGAMAVLSAVCLLSLWLVLRAALDPLHRATADILAMVSGHKPLAALAVARDDEAGAMIAAFNALQAKVVASEVRLLKSQAVLREREALYHSLFEGCRAVELLIDPDDGSIVDANAAAVDYYGWPKDVLTSMRMADIDATSIHGEDGSWHTRISASDHAHLRHRIAAGTVRDVEVWSGPVVVSGRKLTYAIVHDVTARRRAEAALRSTMARLELVLDAAAEGICGVGANGTISFANRAAAELLNWPSPDSMLGHRPAVALGHRLADGCQCRDETCAIAATLKDGETRRIAQEFFGGSDGRPRPVDYVVSALTTGTRVTGAVVVFRDVTEARASAEALRDRQAQMETLTRELARSNAELENFAYVASHDLRQPLRSIAGHLGLLNRRLKNTLDEADRDSLTFAIDSARRMDRMIIELLEYSRIGRVEQPREPVPLAEVVEQAIAWLSGSIAEAAAEIAVAPGLPVVEGYAGELGRLFQNLLSNAVKFRMQGRPPRVAVEWDEAPEHWTVRVRDNGIGIEAHGQGRLFNIFQRLVTQDEYEGTGIGLASCRKIVEHHGGEIQVDSIPGEGSTFVLTLAKVGPARLPDVRIRGA